MWELLEFLTYNGIVVIIKYSKHPVQHNVLRDVKYGAHNISKSKSIHASRWN